jgi:hypothetical protein
MFGTKMRLSDLHSSTNLAFSISPSTMYYDIFYLYASCTHVRCLSESPVYLGRAVHGASEIIPPLPPPPPTLLYILIQFTCHHQINS